MQVPYLFWMKIPRAVLLCGGKTLNVLQLHGAAVRPHCAPKPLILPHTQPPTKPAALRGAARPFGSSARLLLCLAQGLFHMWTVGLGFTRPEVIGRFG